MAKTYGFQIASQLASKHLIDADNVKGGLCVVKNIADRDDLPVAYGVTDGIITKGSFVYCQSTSELYVCTEIKFVGGKPVATWTEFVSGGDINPMVFMGTLGTSGTIKTLPNTSDKNKGYVYKVVTDGTYTYNTNMRVTAKVGDTLVSNETEWVLIPSGDEPTYTVVNKQSAGLCPILPNESATTKFLRQDGTWQVPNYPTPNNGILTIQRNGIDVQTFSADQKLNVTANISVPTKVSELTNDRGYTTNIGTVTSVRVGTNQYSPTEGVVSLPAYPTSLPASDVPSWAKASEKPTYTLDEVSDGTSRKLSNYLPLVGGGTVRGATSSIHTPLVIQGSQSQQSYIQYTNYNNVSMGRIGVARLNNEYKPIFSTSTTVSANDVIVVKSDLNSTSITPTIYDDTKFLMTQGSTTDSFGCRSASNVWNYVKQKIVGGEVVATETQLGAVTLPQVWGYDKQKILNGDVVGDGTHYGAVKLSDSIDDDYSESDGYAATSKAVKKLADMWRIEFTGLSYYCRIDRDNISSGNVGETCSGCLVEWVGDSPDVINAGDYIHVNIPFSIQRQIAGGLNYPIYLIFNTQLGYFYFKIDMLYFYEIGIAEKISNNYYLIEAGKILTLQVGSNRSSFYNVEDPHGGVSYDADNAQELMYYSTFNVNEATETHKGLVYMSDEIDNDTLDADKSTAATPKAVATVNARVDDLENNFQTNVETILRAHGLIS